MANVKVIFGSTTGSTESAAAEIAAVFGVQAINVANATADDFKVLRRFLTRKMGKRRDYPMR